MPTAHAEQVTDDAVAAKVPPAHRVQSPAFVVLEVVPGPQAAHTVSAVAVQAVARRVPGWQAEQVTQAWPASR